jgi:enterobactin synthetase component D
MPVSPNPHLTSQRVCSHWLHGIDVAFSPPFSPETRTRLPRALLHAPLKRQREFLAGRWCAEKALQCLGIGSTHIGMAEDRTPIWPDGVVGSITHTGEFAAAAVSWAVDIAALGIDSEQIIDNATACDIAEICMVDEMSLFSAAHGPSIPEFCTFVFSAKEAVFKCLFPITRKFLEFSDVRITSLDWNRNRFTWTATFSETDGMGRLSCANGMVHTSVELSCLGNLSRMETSRMLVQQIGALHRSR